MPLAAYLTLSLSPRLAEAGAPGATPAPTATPAPPAAAGPKDAPGAQATPTPTPEETNAAQQHYQSGVSFFQAGNYPAARAEFEAAYQLTHYPDLLFNLAEVAQKQGRSSDEQSYLEQYLATNPKDAAEVRTRLDQLRALHPVDPGHAPAAAIGLTVGGGAALIIGLACGGAAIAAANTVADPMNSGKPFTADLFATQERGKQLSSSAIALDVVGGSVLAAGGAWLGYWAYKKHQAKKAAPAPTTALLPNGLGLSLIGGF